MIERQASILLPLFALRSRSDWGIGDLGALGRFAAWVAAAGHRRVQLLPFFEMPPGERSPYSALSGAAIDPIYVSVDALDDLDDPAGREALDRGREAVAGPDGSIAYDAVRAAKEQALRAAFRRFEFTERGGSLRRREFDTFCAGEAWWLDAYAGYRARRFLSGELPWTAWSTGEASQGMVATEAAFRCYVQWQAARQWRAARAEASRCGVSLDGDLPFLVATDSEAVWSERQAFRIDLSVGVPPDAFASEGQDWGLPAPRWDEMEAGDFSWLRGRARRLAELCDGFRIDHVVGYFRTWLRGPGESGRFEPAGEDAQRTGGLRKLTAIGEAARDAVLTGEDLGLIPDFVRAAVESLGLPGYRVLRWERDQRGFREPRGYPPCSVATSGTHDLAPLATWWTDELADEDRRALAQVPSFSSLAASDARFTPAVHAALLDGLYGAASVLTSLPFQDAYGGRERINLPASTGSANWAYRIPWYVEELGRGPAAERSAELHARVRRTAR